jgi:uncharacterized membrane protein YbhN (UPF0104 family)
MLKQGFRVPLSHGFLFQFIDRIFGLYLLVLFALGGALMVWYPHPWTGLLLIGGAALLLYLFFRTLRVCYESMSRFGVPEYGGRLFAQLGRDKRSQGAMLVGKAFRYLAYILLFLFIARLFGLSIGFFQAWMIVSVSTFAGVVSMIPLGIASLDASMLALGNQAGIPLPVGLALISVFRLVTVLPVVILGAAGGIWFSQSMENKK